MTGRSEGEKKTELLLREVGRSRPRRLTNSTRWACGWDRAPLGPRRGASLHPHTVVVALRSCPGHHQFGHIHLISLRPSSPVFWFFTDTFLPHPLVVPHSQVPFNINQNKMKQNLLLIPFSFSSYCPIYFLSFLPSLLLPERPSVSMSSVPFIAQSSVLAFLPPLPTQHARARTHTTLRRRPRARARTHRASYRSCSHGEL